MTSICGIRWAMGSTILCAAFLLSGNAGAAEQANGLNLEPPIGWARTQEGPNVVYRSAACSLSVTGRYRSSGKPGIR
jgi:hypothetical protein